MFRKSDYFILLAVMISFFVSAYLWFAVQDREQAIFTALWIPSIFGFGIYFKLAALMGKNQMSPDKLLILGAFVFGLLLVGLVLTVLEFRKND